MFPMPLISVTRTGCHNPLSLAPVASQRQPATTFIFGSVRVIAGLWRWTLRAQSRRELQRSDFAMMSIVLVVIQLRIVRGGPNQSSGAQAKAELTDSPALSYSHYS